MRVLQYYDYRKMNSDLVASGLGRIRDLTRVCNERRAKAKPPLPPLSFDAVTRLLRGDSHNAAVAKTVAEVFGKTEVAYRLDAPPPVKTEGRKPRGVPTAPRPRRVAAKRPTGRKRKVA